MAVSDELQRLFADLVNTAEPLEGTKTAGHALVFAGKLQQLLGKTSLETLAQGGLEISLNKSASLENLAGKMLHEAENTKLHLVQTSLQEITIPAMKAVSSEGAPVADVPAESEEAAAETPVPKGKTLIPENTAGETSSEQGEAGLRGKPQTARVLSKETESMAELKQPITADTAPGLKPVQNETIVTEHVRTQVDSKADVTGQIVEKAETMIREDKSEMILQLKPESLGKISLKVIHERGEIIARFVAESEQVKAILEGNMQLLKDALQKSGVSIQSLEVSVGQQGREQQRGWNDRRNETMTGNDQKVSARPQKSIIHPVYGYSGSTGYYSAEPSGIDLTA
jgi:flagellar hook-length control protein FliK